MENKIFTGNRRVKPFVGGNKNDAADARAIWTAMQQTVLALHRMRAQLMKFCEAQINGLRGLTSEYGEVMPLGRAWLSWTSRWSRSRRDCISGTSKKTPVGASPKYRPLA